jgi:hypothetical protein
MRANMKNMDSAVGKLFVKKSLQQKGMVLVLVLIFLLAISLISVSSITSSKVQLTLLNNQQIYLQAMGQLSNTKQLILSQLTGDIYSEQILKLSVDRGSENAINLCNTRLGANWLLLDLNQNLNSEYIELTKLLAMNNIKSYLRVISIELNENGDGTANTSTDINLLSKRQETLHIKQCLPFTNSDLWLLETSIISRRTIGEVEMNKFNISSVFYDIQIKQAGSENEL